MLDQCGINAKQLTPSPGDVFKACLAVRQTGRERGETVFNTVWHFAMSREQKGIPPRTLTYSAQFD